MNLINTQTYQNNIPDFFYNVNFAGPIFDQSLYIITVSNFSVAFPINSSVFTFHIQLETNYTRPSFVSTTSTGRSLNYISENITVTSDNSNFVVRQLTIGSYELVTNVYPLNYFEPYHRYVFNLIATQRFVNQPPVNSIALVEINLVNYNVHAPIFISPNQIFYISESASVGTLFGTIYATDADNDTIIYTTTSTQFYINQITGVLTLQQAFSFSRDLQYSMIITASDDGSSCLPTYSFCPRFSTTINITINVLVENMNTPTFLDNICEQTLTLYENSHDTNLTTIRVSDSDVGRNGQITISLVSDQCLTMTYSQFYLVHSDQTDTIRTAYLRANTTFDYDTATVRSWYLYIRATDKGIPQRQAVCGLHIKLSDVNDNPPIFARTFWNYTIYRLTYQNMSNPHFLRIIASDADSGVNGQINYYIGSISVPYFTINQTTGMILLRSTMTINDLLSSLFPITFQVYAQDRGSPRLLSPVNATVIIYYNTNDSWSALWYSPIYAELNFRIIEKFHETYPSQSIFSTLDNFNGTIFYTTTSSLTTIMTVQSPFSSTNFPFTAASTTKIGNIFRSGIVVTSNLDAEITIQYLIYNIVPVQPALIGVTTVNLIDQNDQIPTFYTPSMTITVVKNQNALQKLLTIQAIDRDVDYPNNDVQYQLNTVLTEMETLSRFFITLNGSVWTNSTFASTNQTQYQLIITAYNTVPAWNNQIYTQDFQLNVLITSLTNSPPVFVNSSNMFIIINETTGNGTEILELHIIDPDIDTILTFGIMNGNIRNAFAFYFVSDNSANNSRTQYEAIGKLYVIGPLNYETTSNYTLTLFIFDAKNMVNLTVFIDLQARNTKAPKFNLMPGFFAYLFNVTESTAISILDGHTIEVTDADSSSTTFVFDIVTNNYQYNLNSLYLNQSNNQVTIGIKTPGLVRDLPFGSSQYNFSIKVTDENGSGVSTYVPVTIFLNDLNNNGPIPTNGPWYLTEGVMNASTIITFIDFDDSTLNNTLPFRIQSISPSPPFSISPTVSYNNTFMLRYIGVLNRSITKNISVTFNVTDGKGYPAATTIPIIIADVLSATSISDGSKTINVIYVDGYINSLRNVALGSIYVNDFDDWFRINRTYSVRDTSNGLTFNATNGWLSTSNALYSGTATIHIDVTKPIASSTALSTIYLTVSSVDREYVRKAATIRIQGEYPETLIDPSLGNRLNTLVNALASILSVNKNSITILTIRSVNQYRNPYYPPLPYDQAKQQALTDVIFYVSSLEKQSIETTLNTNLALFSSNFGIIANASGPDPCLDYFCPTGTTCRPARTIQPLPTAIDTNQTSFVGINILDSADCVNATYALYNPTASTVLGRTFTGNGNSYAVFDGTQFSNLAPTRFSFDFVGQSPLTDGLILLYGRNTMPINDFFWIAIELYQSQLRFHFRDTILNTSNLILNASTWYHVEYQYVSSTILLSINDYQYFLTVNDTLNTYDLSNVRLYLGGFPPTGSIISGLYSSLTQINSFSGCIRNLLSNGYYVDMSSSISSANSNTEQCSCNITNSCTTSTSQEIPAVIVPWYTWLIIALVFLFLTTIIILIFVACTRRKEQQKASTQLYHDDARDNIIVYRDGAGEEDHWMYNLNVLKKPVYSISDDEILANTRRSGLYHNDCAEAPASDGQSLKDYINEKLTEQKNYSLADDTQLHYRYEGEGSIISDLSAIELDQDEDDDPLGFFSLNIPKHFQFDNSYIDDIQ